MANATQTIHIVDVGGARTGMLMLFAAAGNLAASVEMTGCGKSAFRTATVSIVQHALDVAIYLGIDLHNACLSKMSLNEKKYPPALCGKKVSQTAICVCALLYAFRKISRQEKIQKYTLFSDKTGITPNNQSIGQNNETAAVSANEAWWKTFGGDALKEITEKSKKFVVDRQWQRYDTRRNLAMAIGSEAGELVEILAWTGDDIARDKYSGIADKVSQELADIIILVVRLAALDEIDLQTCVRDYVEHKADKFRVLAM